MGESFDHEGHEIEVRRINSLNFVLFVSFVVRWIFLIERGYYGQWCGGNRAADSISIEKAV